MWWLLEHAWEAPPDEQKPQFVLDVDLDGVCVDFYGKLRRSGVRHQGPGRRL
ncbi:MAG TPA: hypothetical protein VG144_04420 [Gaiellaceae bacterium]|nr:hypothetical protein [Gaiellaceae bacterium]